MSNRETLVILNYQREIPPFMITQIRIAREYFQKVYYITRELDNNNSSFCRYENVSIIQIKPNHSRPDHLMRLFGMFLHGGSEGFAAAKADGIPFFEVLKERAKSELCSNLLFSEAKKIIKRENPSQCVVLATWFGVEAEAAAKLKSAFPSVVAVSFAHSFEVQKSKNRFIPYNRLSFKHECLDKVLFISNNVLQEYKTEYLDSLNIDQSNISVVYLGCLRDDFEYLKREKKNEIRLVSCSGVTAVKRVELIIEALSIIKDIRISWTHLGSGPLLDVCIQKASSLPPNVSTNLIGRLDNAEVHKYYQSHRCDLFINVSSEEGLPVSLMECMAYGIPAIATDVGGNSEIVLNGRTGFLLSKDPTPDEIANVIKEYYLLADSDKECLRTACMKLWSEKFDADKNAREIYSHLSGE